jgi:tripartite-type tricarboxylate transporter receptor subunit TctC
MAGIDLIHVPYKGASPATTDLLGGQVQAMLNNLLASSSQIRAGRLRAIAVTSPKRSPALADVPTVSESGVAGYEVTGWYGLLAPRGTTQSAAVVVQEAVGRALRRPAVAERLAVDGALPVANSPPAFAKYLLGETEKWAKVIKRAGIKPETL